MSSIIKNTPKKILIIKPSSLGDIVHSLPFLHAISKRFPQAEIHWVVARGLHTILAGHPLIKKLWVIDKDKWKKLSNIFETLREVIAFWRDLRKEGFDISVDLSGLLRSGLITFASGAKIKMGFSDSDEGSPFFYNTKIEGGTDIHAIDRYLKLAEMLGCNIDDIRYPMAPLDPTPKSLKDLPGKYLVMSPSAGKEANRWPAERFGQLAAKLPIPSIVISSLADKDVADKVVALSSGKAISMAGKTSLTELFILIAKARCFISNDTGPMHIAAAQGVPVFAIFGPANPARTGPYGKAHTVISHHVDCAPCYAWKPCDHWECMDKLDVETVYNTIMAKGIA